MNNRKEQIQKLEEKLKLNINNITNLGAHFENNCIRVRALNLHSYLFELIIYDKKDTEKIIKEIAMNQINEFVSEAIISNKYEGYPYQFRVTFSEKNGNSVQKLALDPYAKSMVPFNWDGKEEKVGKGVFVNLKSPESGFELIEKSYKADNFIPKGYPSSSVYELHIRDFTSNIKNDSLEEKEVGTFKGAIKSNIFNYLDDLQFNVIQLLPIQSTYTVNDNDKKILEKGQGKGWTTNYNWGYDPHNYFSINGVYSTNPNDPYARIREFREFVQKAHEQGIAVILDVVFNHTMINEIFNNLDPITNYYYRNEAETKPVNLPPIASNRILVRKFIIDCLEYWVNEFQVDGFRFDLSSFLDKTTLIQAKEIFTKNSYKAHNGILHGEAWNFTDLTAETSWIKGKSDNEYQFGYFNDSIRNAIKGSDHSNDKGIVIKNDLDKFKSYVSQVVGGIKNYEFDNTIFSNDPYDLFTDYPKVSLSYNACHDGATLWDKINSSSNNLSFLERVNRYLQALILTYSVQGNVLNLAGTELLQSKPNDNSGMDAERSNKSNYPDELDDNPDDNSYATNSYKTTDFVNCLKWHHINKLKTIDKKYNIAEILNSFIKTLNYLKIKKANFFNKENILDIKQNIKFLISDFEKGILIYEFKSNGTNGKYLIMHNFGENDFAFKHDDYELILNSKIDTKNNLDILEAHSSKILFKNN